MSVSQEMYIATSFKNIHSIITRGVSVALENLQQFSKQGFKDA
jgi:hypothetical protein